MEDQSQTRKVVKMKEKAKRWTNQPVLVKWGLAVLVLFTGFAVTSQIQNSNNNSDRVHDAVAATKVAQQAADQARMAAYEAQYTTYLLEHKDWVDCHEAVKTRDSLREIFFGITHEPAALLPNSPEAAQFENDLNNLIEKGFKARSIEDCGEEPLPPEPLPPITTNTEG